MKFLMHCLLCLSLPAFAQEPKGVTPLSSLIAHHATRAVVVGISNYQDEGIPDLRFADKDAEAFANFLRSPAGGSLDGDHLNLLTNEQATAGRIAEVLDALIEQTKEGDHVIIYFSGHGDVERKTVSQPGFLLCWDSPPQVYMGGGTYSLAFLQEVVTTLCVQNKAKVILITDACHAGKLAGSQIGGAQLTSVNLARHYANEVKILSCQPNEFSLEGEQWGGGRGVFSYHLVDGLVGLADRNRDAVVTVGELDRYLEDHVSEEVAPQAQVPILLGNKMEQLAVVNPAMLADWEKIKSGQTAIFTATEGRNLEDEVLGNVDTSLQQMYRAFKLAIQEKRFLEPVGNCAEAYYTQLIHEAALAPLHGFMRRNYAAALQDDAQQVMNKWLKVDIQEVARSTKSRLDKYKNYPRYLERAAELLGNQHYMYPVLQARKHFFQGNLLALSNRRPDVAWGEKTLEQFRLALSWQPDMPQAYYWISYVYSENIVQLDSLQYYAMRAAELAPNWVLPYIFAAKIIVVRSENYFDLAKPYLEKATQLDSNSTIVWATWGFYYLRAGNVEKARRYTEKALQIDSTFLGARMGLGLILFGTGHFSEAKEQLNKVVQADSTADYVYHALGDLSMVSENYSEAEQNYLKAIALDSTTALLHYKMGMVNFRTGQPKHSRQYFLKASQLNPNFGNAMLGMAYLLDSEGKTTEAIQYVEQAIEKGVRFKFLENDKDLSHLRTLPEWKVLMQKHFPDQYKD